MLLCGSLVGTGSTHPSISSMIPKQPIGDQGGSWVSPSRGNGSIMGPIWEAFVDALGSNILLTGGVFIAIDSPEYPALKGKVQCPTG